MLRSLASTCRGPHASARAFASGASGKRRRRRPGGKGVVSPPRPEMPLLKRNEDGHGRPLVTDEEDERVARSLFRGTPMHVSSGYENLPGVAAFDDGSGGGHGAGGGDFYEDPFTQLTSSRLTPAEVGLPAGLALCVEASWRLTPLSRSPSVSLSLCVARSLSRSRSLSLSLSLALSLSLSLSLSLALALSHTHTPFSARAHPQHVPIRPAGRGAGGRSHRTLQRGQVDAYQRALVFGRRCQARRSRRRRRRPPRVHVKEARPNADCVCFWDRRRRRQW